MHAYVFNACLLIGWLLALAGGVLVNLGVGLAAGGLLLIALVLLSARMAGGLYMPGEKA